VSQKFTERDYERYGIKCFKNAGFEISVWDVTPILYPIVGKLYSPPDPLINKNIVFRFQKKQEVLKLIKTKNRDTLFISTIGFKMNTLFIYKMITQKNLLYSCTGPFVQNIFPILKLKYSKKKVINEWINRIKIIVNPKKFINSLLMTKIPISLLGIKPAILFFLHGGSLAYAKGPLITKKTKVIKIYNPIYDLYIESKENNRSNNKINSIIFVDQNLPSAMDSYYDGSYKNNIKPDLYYIELNRFFDYLESMTGLEVIIAASPKSNYRTKGYFKERNVIRGNTAELIKNSKLVIGHFSMGIYLAVLFKKPILFFTTDDLTNIYSNHHINAFSNALDQTPINISDQAYNIWNEDIFSINENCYNNFIKNYIKIDEKFHGKYWDNVIEEIRKING
jgi:hypothetical protein